MSELLYKNVDVSLTVKIKEEIISDIYKLCQDSYPKETGGILIGKYSSDLKCAQVTIMTGEPEDSASGRTWFFRGTNGLQQLLDEIWETKREFYIGEWHYHPTGAPTPSVHDIVEMKRISKKKAYNCPEPILIIAGSIPPDYWNIAAYVFVGGRKCSLLPN